ncbi:MAG TPA: alkaline phosphatase family protein, partial [Thermoanaerobaculia bacterium]
RGHSISVASTRVAFVTPGGTQCAAPRRGEQLYFQREVRAGETDLNINFAYDPPAVLPDDWPAGDWCASLATFVNHNVRANANDDPRASELRISGDLQRALANAGLKTSSVSVRLQLPPGWERTRPVPEIARLAKAAPPLLFIGLDGADWQLLDDYIAAGAMPNLARLAREGTSGTLETEHPPLSPLLWTTMMTGVSPLEHHILDFTHFNHSTGAKEPITSDERAVPAVWNMATAAGKRVAVFGLWATYPAEPVRGLLVSDRLFTFLFSESTPPPGIVFPPSREPWARNGVDTAEKSIDFVTLKRYLPWLTQPDYDDLAHAQNPYEKPGSALRRILVETEVYRRLATDVVSSSMPDLTIVYIQGTDTIGHVFAPFAPPRQSGINQADYERYHQVPELYFRHIDEILGDFVRAAEHNHARVMLASDHGFRWKEGRPVELSSVATATAAKWHRNEGIFLLWGPGIPASDGHRVHGGIRQICATLLDLSGLPAAAGVAPPLLPEHATQSADYRRSFTPFTPPAPNAVTAASANEELSKLKALGYIGSSESTSARPAGVSSTKTAGAFNNEGLILKHDNRIADAVAAFHQALTLDPNLASAAWNLSDLLFSRNENLAEADDLLLRALQNGLPEASKYVIERAIKYQRSGHADRSLALLEGAVSRAPADEELRMFRGRYRIEQKNCAGALEDFEAAEKLRPNDPIAFASAGLAEMCLGDRGAAQASFEKSLAINPNQPQLRQFLQH